MATGAAASRASAQALIFSETVPGGVAFVAGRPSPSPGSLSADDLSGGGGHWRPAGLGAARAAAAAWNRPGARSPLVLACVRAAVTPAAEQRRFAGKRAWGEKFYFRLYIRIRVARVQRSPGRARPVKPIFWFLLSCPVTRRTEKRKWRRRGRAAAAASTARPRRPSINGTRAQHDKQRVEARPRYRGDRRPAPAPQARDVRRPHVWSRTVGAPIGKR